MARKPEPAERRIARELFVMLDSPNGRKVHNGDWKVIQNMIHTRLIEEAKAFGQRVEACLLVLMKAEEEKRGRK